MLYFEIVGVHFQHQFGTSKSFFSFPEYILKEFLLQVQFSCIIFQLGEIAKSLGPADKVVDLQFVAMIGTTVCYNNTHVLESTIYEEARLNSLLSAGFECNPVRL